MRFSARNVLLSVAVVLLSACGGGGGSDNSDKPDDTPRASLRIINAAADAPAVGFELGDDVGGVSGIDYAKGSGLARIDAGSYEGTFTANLPSGKADLSDAETLVLEEDVQYEVVLLGNYDALETLVYEIPVEFDTKKVRFQVAHLSASMEPVDVYVSKAGDPIDASVVMESLEYKEAAEAAIIDSGAYRIRITPAAGSEVIYDSGSITLAAGNDIFVTVLDNAWLADDSVETAESPVVVSVFSKGGQSTFFDKDRPAYVRTFHASPDAPAMDVIIDQSVQPLVENLSFGQFTDSHRSVPKANVDLQVVATGTTSAYIDKSDINFSGGGSYTLFLTDVLDDINTAFLADGQRVIASQASYRLVNMITGGDELDLYVVKKDAAIAEIKPTVDKFKFGSYSQFFASAAGEFELMITEKGSKTLVVDPIPLEFALGKVYTVVLRDGEGLTEPTVTVMAD